MLIYRKNIFSFSFISIFYFFKKSKIGIVAYSFQIKTDPNQVMMQACVLKKL